MPAAPISPLITPLILRLYFRCRHVDTFSPFSRHAMFRASLRAIRSLFSLLVDVILFRYAAILMLPPFSRHADYYSAHAAYSPC